MVQINAYREREQKFLLKSKEYVESIYKCKSITQGYLQLDPERCVRVRYTPNDSYLTIKGISTPDGLERYEFENKIDDYDAEQLLKLCGDNIISKTRFYVKAQSSSDLVWEIDVFDDIDLVLAEIETTGADDEFVIEDWLGEEVTGNVKYYNTDILRQIKSAKKKRN